MRKRAEQINNEIVYKEEADTVRNEINLLLKEVEGAGKKGEAESDRELLNKKKGAQLVRALSSEKVNVAAPPKEKQSP